MEEESMFAIGCGALTATLVVASVKVHRTAAQGKDIMPVIRDIIKIIILLVIVALLFALR